MTDADMTCFPEHSTGEWLSRQAAVCSLSFSLQSTGLCLPQEPNVPFTPFCLEQVRGRHGISQALCYQSALLGCTNFLQLILSLVSVCSLPSIAHTLLNEEEKGKSITQAFQINCLFFEQGSDWRRLWDGSSINRVTWGQLACYMIWSTRELHSRYLHSCATSSFLKPGPACSQVASPTAEVTCCCIIHQWTTTCVTISSFRWLCFFGFGFFF